MYSFSFTDPAATPILTFNMVNRIPPGVTIATASVQTSPFSGSDPNASALLGPVTISGMSVIVQWAAGGKSGMTYVVTITCVGSDGLTYVGSGLLPIRKGGL
jgi:hypothetical protein